MTLLLIFGALLKNFFSTDMVFKIKPYTVADPGFLRGGGANPLEASTYDFAKNSQKLHEIERISMPGGGHL